MIIPGSFGWPFSVGTPYTYFYLGALAYTQPSSLYAVRRSSYRPARGLEIPFLKEGILSINSDRLANKFSAALSQAREQGKPFVVEWRPEARPSQSHAEYDAGCGCGPVDLPNEPSR
jgi:hypothetical protein